MNPQPGKNLPSFDKQDAQLDQALATYTPAEARPGLEQRVLASLTANTAGSSAKTAPIFTQRPLPWAIAASLLAVASITGFFLHHPAPSQDKHQIAAQSTPPVTKPNPAAQAKVSQPAIAQPARELPTHFVPSRASAKNTSRQPAPAHNPLQPTSQESELAQLAQFVNRHPNAAASLIRLQANIAKPLEIAPIRPEPITIKEINIPPLDIDAPRPEPHPLQPTSTL